MPENHAAYHISKNAQVLQIKPAPYASPGPHQILIKNAALAINPLDWAKQLMGDMMFSWLAYPIILGSDVAGSIVEVGTDVDPARFQIGTRVVGTAANMDKRGNNSAEGGFQEYTVLRTNMCAKIPDHISFANACVLGLAVSTASCALFMEDFLGLEYPTSPPRKSNGKIVLIWGGSTSVGCNAIQLAKAAGYEVVTTASPRNFEYLKTLGAGHAFDYHDEGAVADIIKVMNEEGKECAGALAIGFGSTEKCLAVVAACKGKKFVAQASAPVDIGNWPEGAFGMAAMVVGMLRSNLSLALKSRWKGVGVKFVFGTDLMANEVGDKVWKDFMERALEKGEFVCAPGPLVVGKGLEKLQEAMDLNKEGVSAKKVVVLL